MMSVRLMSSSMNKLTALRLQKDQNQFGVVLNRARLNQSQITSSLVL